VATAACHPVSQETYWTKSSCVEGYLLSNRYLGDSFLLQVSAIGDFSLQMAPLDGFGLSDALWAFTPRTGVSEAYSLVNHAAPGLALSSGLRMVPGTEEPDTAWYVEAVDPEVAADVDLHLIHPAEAPLLTLDTSPEPPYALHTSLGRGDAGQHWHLQPYQYCREDQ